VIVLGVNAYHGDASAAVLVDGRLAAAVEEERFTRVKHAAGFPSHSVRWCLARVGARLSDVDHVAVPRDPWARWPAKLRHALRMPAFAFDRVRVAARTGRVARALADSTGDRPGSLRARLHRVEHHRAHLASAFLVSPFERCAVLSLDGLGDFGSGLWGVGEGNQLKATAGAEFPHSVGLFYTALTQYLGFPAYGDEYKVMGLAAYGRPTRLAEMRGILRDDASSGYRLELRYFRHHRRGPGMTWEEGAPVLEPLYSTELERLLGSARPGGGEPEPRHADLAASLQARLEEVVHGLMRKAAEAAGSGDLAFAGGVAFNCVANGRALTQGVVNRLFVQPAAGDAGLALGAALSVWHETLGRPRQFVMDHAYWGPDFAEAELVAALSRRRLAHRRLSEGELARVVAERLAEGAIVGWFRGRAEWGPRALGSRSILADPRRAETRERLNDRIKRRESFRPFAPSVLAERAADWFEGPAASPFMLLALPVRAARRSAVGAVTHADGSARLHTVDRAANPGLWDLIRAFEARTGVPMLLNTSFNDQQPIVNTPDEAIDCFLTAGLDLLVLENLVVESGD
jgi:carbamoyltransferase